MMHVYLRAHVTVVICSIPTKEVFLLSSGKVVADKCGLQNDQITLLVGKRSSSPYLLMMA
jgi:hypothetical protein